MNCFNHPDLPAAAYCRSCGRPLCVECQRTVNGVIFCPEHAPAAVPPPPVAPVVPPPPPPEPANPYATPSMGVAGGAAGGTIPPVAPAAQVVGGSPGLAFLLGLIPGVGAIYNGQYVKGLVHAAIIGLLFSLANESAGPLVVLSIIAFWIYMPFEAYHTARKRQFGLPVDEWSSLGTPSGTGSRVPIGPIILILLGVVFLLNSLNLLDLRLVIRFWPVLLIVLGIMMLVRRVKSSGAGVIHEPLEGR